MSTNTLLVTAEIIKDSVFIKCINRSPDLLRDVTVIIADKIIDMGNLKPGSVKQTVYSVDIIPQQENFTIHIRGKNANNLSNVIEGVPYTISSGNTDERREFEEVKEIKKTDEDREKQADISVKKRCIYSIDNLTAGQSVCFEVTVRNDGPDDASNIVITEIINYDFIGDIYCEDETYDNGLWRLDRLICGEEKILIFTALLKKSGRCIISTVASADESDPNTENNSATIYLKAT